MTDLSIFRELYGHVYVTTLPDGVSIPWKPLPIGEVVRYTRLFKNNKVPVFILENEIFKKCVVDQNKVRNFGLLKAGTISLVAQNILTASGVPSIDAFNQLLDQYRVALSNEAIHDFVMIICATFPAYKPEDVYAMDYHTFIERLVLAERLQMHTGQREEPILLSTPGEEEAPKRERVDPRSMKEMFEQQQRRPSAEEVLRQQSNAQGRSKKRASDNVQKSYSSNRETVVSRSDMREHTMALDGHERENLALATQEQFATMKEIYQPYVEQMKRGEKVQIMSEEERVELHHKRTKQSKVRLKERSEKIKEHYRKIESKKPDKVFRFKKKRGV